jgi:sugar diacid utilization regulator
MIQKEIYKLCNEDSHIFVGIGSSVDKVQDIHKSYTHAKSAYQLTKSALNSQILCYDELGVYKMLSNLKEPGLGDQYIEEVLGELILFDKNNQTDFVHILQVFFENECSILMASKALYCHKNTLTYKLNKIKDILGYDILANEKRMAIMLAFHLLKMRQ